MRPSSLPGLSPRARALLAAEREILPQAPELRRRAQLRARTALWQARNPHGLQVRFVSAWKQVRVLLVAALGATSALAAWQQLAPGPVDAPPAVAIGTPVPATAARAPRTALPIAKTSATPRAEPAPAASAPARPSASLPARSRLDAPRKPAAPSEELALLDSARRAVMARSFERALRTLERHARSFPHSPLGEEREALRVRALRGVGRSTQANHAAREFEARYPSSVLAPELNKGD